jgi:hypothetical protein
MIEGKWYFDDEDSTVSVVENGIPLEVCTVCTFDEVDSRWVFGEKTKANAALLTSAPELLEALELLLDRYTGLINCGDCGNWNPKEESEVIKARAAIAAARGNE